MKVRHLAKADLPLSKPNEWIEKMSMPMNTNVSANSRKTGIFGIQTMQRFNSWEIEKNTLAIQRIEIKNV